VLFFRVGQVEVTVRANSSNWQDDLFLEVKSDDSDSEELSRELFGALNNWASDVEAPIWQQKWRSLNSIFWFALILWVSCGLVAIPSNRREDAPTAVSKAEARKLLSKGINLNNQQQALALLLAIESDYDSGTAIPSLGVTYWSYFSLGTLFLLCTLICPKFCVGVWEGKKQVKRWRGWLTMITVTIPILIVGSALLPWMLHWLHLSPPNP
jgi:hypothetical protein